MKKYTKYKDSGIEWIGEIPQHWETMLLKRLVSSHKQGYYTSESYTDEGVKLFVRLENATVEDKLIDR